MSGVWFCSRTVNAENVGAQVGEEEAGKGGWMGVNNDDTACATRQACFIPGARLASSMTRTPVSGGSETAAMPAQSLFCGTEGLSFWPWCAAPHPIMSLLLQ